MRVIKISRVYFRQFKLLFLFFRRLSFGLNATTLQALFFIRVFLLFDGQTEAKLFLEILNFLLEAIVDVFIFSILLRYLCFIADGWKPGFYLSFHQIFGVSCLLFQFGWLIDFIFISRYFFWFIIFFGIFCLRRLPKFTVCPAIRRLLEGISVSIQ